MTTYPTFEVLANPDWASLFVDATNITTKLVNSTKFVVTDGQGGTLTITGTGLEAGSFLGYQVLTGNGKITGFNISVGHSTAEIAFGKGYHVTPADVLAAMKAYYFEGQKNALIQLWFNVKLEIVGTAAHIAANLPQLEEYATNVVAVHLTSGDLDVSVSDITTYKNILDAVVGGYVVKDTAKNIGKGFATLAANVDQVKSIAFVGAGEHTLALSAAVASADAAALEKVAGAYLLEILAKDGAWTTKGHGDDLTIHALKNDTITGGGTGERFVFATGFGHDVVADFGSHLNGSTHDALDWSAFASLGAALDHAKQVGHDLVITDAKGDTLTLDGVTKHMLAAAQSSDFKWG